jgi:hypothetical protein
MSEISKVDLIQVESKAVVTDVRENRGGEKGKDLSVGPMLLYDRRNKFCCSMVQ